MRYVKKHTSIPIPVVLHHDPDSDKQVGGEWMIMEHVRNTCYLARYITNTI